MRRGQVRRAARTGGCCKDGWARRQWVDGGVGWREGVLTVTWADEWTGSNAGRVAGRTDGNVGKGWAGGWEGGGVGRWANGCVCGRRPWTGGRLENGWVGT